MYRIYLIDGNNNIELDCEDLDFGVEFKVSSLKDLSFRSGNRTKEIVLKGTETNNNAFGYLYRLGRDTDFGISNKLLFNYNALRPVDCVVYKDSYLIFRGSLRLLEITRVKGVIYYKGVITDSVSDVMISTKERYLDEIDLNDLKHYYSFSNIQSSWNTSIQRFNGTTFYDTPFDKGSGYVYPEIYYGWTLSISPQQEQIIRTAYRGSKIYPVENYRPALYVKEVFNRIFSDLGYTWEYRASQYEVDKFESLIIPNNEINLTSNLEDYQLKLYKCSGNFTSAWEGGLNAPDNTSATFNAYLNTSCKQQLGDQSNQDIVALETSSGLSPIQANAIWTFDVDVKTDIKVVIDLTQITGVAVGDEISFYVARNKKPISDLVLFPYTLPGYWDTLASKRIVYNGSLPAQIELIAGEYEFEAGDFLTVYISNDQYNVVNANPPFIDGDVSVYIPSIRKTIKIEYAIGNIIEPTLPKNVSQYDFIKSIMLMHNMYAFTEKGNDKHLIFQRYDDFYAQFDPLLIKGTSIDWSDKVLYNEEWKKSLNALLPKSYLYTYKEDKDYINSLYTADFKMTYGSFRFEDRYGVNPENVVEIIFSPTPNTLVDTEFGGGKVIPTIRGGDDKENKRIESNIRILYYNGVANYSQPYVIAGNNSQGSSSFIPNVTQYPLTSEYYFNNTTDLTPIDSLQFGIPNVFYFPATTLYTAVPTLYENYYINQVTELTDPNLSLLEVSVYLNPVDVNNFDFRTPVFISTDIGNSYFKVLELNWDNEKKPAKVKLQNVCFIDNGSNIPSNIPITTSTTTTTTTQQIATFSCVENTIFTITNIGWIKYEDCGGVLRYTNITATGSYILTDCHRFDTISKGTPYTNTATWSGLTAGVACGTYIPIPTTTTTTSTTTTTTTRNYGATGATGPQGFQGFQGNQGNAGSNGSQGNQGNAGSNGSQGNQGNAGSNGSQGNQGNAGSNGNQGWQGWQGFQGNQGAQGSAGSNGSQGNQGFQGNIGNQGNQGWQGFQGRQGNQGFQGNQGNQGLIGLTGNQGAQGNAGSNGNQGFQGNQGNQGAIGQGTQGNQGFQGNQGNQGNQGAIGQGTQGNQGFQGLSGSVLIEVTSYGITGSQGFQGAQGGVGNTGSNGSQGFQGNQGNQGLIGLTGTQGFQGRQGFQGWQGNQGNQGNIGSQGNQGNAGSQGNQGLIGVTGAGVQGPQGIAGTNGNQGFQGWQGFQGNQGLIGLTGTQGFQGRQGWQGFQGNQGNQGNIGTQGNQGNVGSQGNQGLIGLTGSGVQGPQGNIGSQGNQGLIGVTGAGVQGPQGNAGSNGNQGFQGNQGLIGITGSQGFQGRQGWQGNQGNTGNTGNTGAQGNQGNAGTNGNQGFQGNQGNVGNTGNTGAQGNQGNTGNTGNTGAQGNQGNTGNTGNTGAQGPQGNVGNTGNTGAQGNQGNAGSNGSNGSQGPQGPGFTTISNPADNRVLTSDGSVNAAVAESRLTFDGSGVLKVEIPSTETAGMELGFGRSGNGFAYIDLIGDATNSDYGLRILRSNGGANAASSFQHKGASSLVFNAEDANSSIAFYTENGERMYIKSNGFVGINRGNPLERLHVDGNVYLEPSNLSSGALLGYYTTGSGETFSSFGVHIPQYGLKWATPSDASGYVGLMSGYYGLRFYTNAAERMRITSNGVAVNSTTNLNGASVCDLYVKRTSGAFAFCVVDTNSSTLLTVDDVKSRFYNRIDATNGSTSSPGYAFGNNTNTGFIGSPGNVSGDSIGVSLNGVEGFRFNKGTTYDFHSKGDVIANSTTPSDERLKDNLREVNGALNMLSQLKGYKFNWKHNGEEDFGLIAQEVEKVFPEMVKEKELPFIKDDSLEYKVVVYEKLIPVLIQAINELNEKINNMNAPSK